MTSTRWELLESEGSPHWERQWGSFNGYAQQGGYLVPVMIVRHDQGLCAFKEHMYVVRELVTY